MKAFFSCREASRRAAEGDDSLAARLHRLWCGPCRRFARQLALLGTSARRWATTLVGPRHADFEARLLRDLRRG